MLQEKVEKNRITKGALRAENTAAQHESKKQANIISECEVREAELQCQITEKNDEIFKLN